MYEFRVTWADKEGRYDISLCTVVSDSIVDAIGRLTKVLAMEERYVGATYLSLQVKEKKE